jgi:hypothetical protein
VVLGEASEFVVVHANTSIRASGAAFAWQVFAVFMQQFQSSKSPRTTSATQASGLP